MYTALVGGLALCAVAAIGQDAPAGGRGGANRAESTRTFLGLGPAPDKAKAALGAPLFVKNCSFCHGPQARGAEGPALITSDIVLDDEHGQQLIPFLKVGRPEKGMPTFASISDEDLGNIVEFLHQQVEDVANRGTYQIKSVVVGNAADGKTYVDANCASCHKPETFDHIAAKFRSPDLLQRAWVWPAAVPNDAFAITAVVKTADGATVEGKVTQVSDFKITVVDAAGQKHVIDRVPGVDVKLHDPLDAHQSLIMTLKNKDMHDVTAYLETLK